MAHGGPEEYWTYRHGFPASEEALFEEHSYIHLESNTCVYTHFRPSLLSMFPIVDYKRSPIETVILTLAVTTHYEIIFVWQDAV
jgi:hypothetical protein